MTYPEPPIAGDEISTLLGSLERQRATLAWKCRGLDAAGLNATVAPSSITLGGLLKHLAANEDHKFGVMLHGHDPQPPFDTDAWNDDPDWEWHSAAKDSPEELTALWEETVARARTWVSEAIADGGLDHAAAYTTREGTHPSLRRIVIDMIEEYARHVGHADFLRESVDGVVGEDPPGGPYPYVYEGRA